MTLKSRDPITIYLGQKEKREAERAKRREEEANKGGEEISEDTDKHRRIEVNREH
jgi:hypothetical protein